MDIPSFCIALFPRQTNIVTEQTTFCTENAFSPSRSNCIRVDLIYTCVDGVLFAHIHDILCEQVRFFQQMTFRPSRKHCFGADDILCQVLASCQRIQPCVWGADRILLKHMTLCLSRRHAVTLSADDIVFEQTRVCLCKPETVWEDIVAKQTTISTQMTFCLKRRSSA